MSLFDDRIFETLFINVVLNNKPFIIGNVYRPVTQHPVLTQSEQFHEFSNNLSAILDLIPDNRQFYMFGDLNLDCLKFGTCTQVTEYVNLLFSFGLLQIVSKPTRCTVNSATLIDHVITNNVNTKSCSFLITNKISDHFPVACFIDNNKYPKSKIFKKSAPY
jgi:Endonuclease-reverse transcriptase